MNNDSLCPICGAGHLTRHIGEVETEYKGRKAMVPSHFSECDACGSEFAGLVDSRANKRAVLAFRKQVDGLLAGAEITALRAHYKINQKQAAILFGGGPVAFSKYENDDVAHSEAMDKLLRLVLRSESVFWELAEQEGMTAELTSRPKHAKHLVFEQQITSNVVVANFGNGGFRPSVSRGMHAYHSADHATESVSGVRKWK